MPKKAKKKEKAASHSVTCLNFIVVTDLTVFKSMENTEERSITQSIDHCFVVCGDLAKRYWLMWNNRI